MRVVTINSTNYGGIKFKDLDEDLLSDILSILTHAEEPETLKISITWEEENRDRSETDSK